MAGGVHGPRVRWGAAAYLSAPGSLDIEMFTGEHAAGGWGVGHPERGGSTSVYSSPATPILSQGVDVTPPTSPSTVLSYTGCSTAAHVAKVIG